MKPIERATAAATVSRIRHLHLASAIASSHCGTGAASRVHVSSCWLLLRRITIGQLARCIGGHIAHTAAQTSNRAHMHRAYIYAHRTCEHEHTHTRIHRAYNARTYDYAERMFVYICVCVRCRSLARLARTNSKPSIKGFYRLK